VIKQYHMPTKILSGDNCIVENSSIFKSIGKKAMLVTGKTSAKKNGAQEEVLKALEKVKIDYVIYDAVMSNPTVKSAYEGATFAIENGIDFIIAIGGGSPMDAAKVMAVLAVNPNIKKEDLFNPQSFASALPIVAIPTTAGTGSEVTPYAI